MIQFVPQSKDFPAENSSFFQKFGQIQLYLSIFNRENTLHAFPKNTSA